MSDLPRLVTMARRFHEESPYNFFTFAPEKVAAQFRGMIDNPDFLVAVGTKKDGPVGMIVAQVLQPIFSHDLCSAEIAWYIQPEDRKGTLGLRLTNFYDEWIAEKGAKVTSYSMLSTSPKSIKEIYTRKGCSPVEITYMRKN
jgi:hypothetical protein